MGLEVGFGMPSHRHNTPSRRGPPDARDRRGDRREADLMRRDAAKFRRIMCHLILLCTRLFKDLENDADSNNDSDEPPRRRRRATPAPPHHADTAPPHHDHTHHDHTQREPGHRVVPCQQTNEPGQRSGNQNHEDPHIDESPLPDMDWGHSDSDRSRD